MEREIKQRLAGAITIVSLAIIFLPLIFDGSGYKQLPDMNLDIPAQPEITIDQRFDMLPAPGKAGLQRLREKIDLNTVTKNSPLESVTERQWKVQVGVFANEENAKYQVLMLEEKGYAAGYRSLIQAGVQKFFVEIGPDNKQKMQQAAEELKSNLGLDDVLLKKQ